MNTWILVADASRARVFRAESPTGGLIEIEDFTHPEARSHDQELTSDLPGRAFDSMGANRHAMEQQTEPKKEEALVFARELGARLEAACESGDYDKLYVIAAPAFLGMLRDALGKGTRGVVAQELDKDLTWQTAEEVRGHLPSHL
ncbi:MAG: host attachment protein [Gammaproteobacteria bacterium]|jgi:protein required for attachment to host cells